MKEENNFNYLLFSMFTVYKYFNRVAKQKKYVKFLKNYVICDNILKNIERSP